MDKLKNIDLNIRGNILYFLLVFYLVFKNVLAYFLEFKLGIATPFQVLIAFMNILAIGLLLYGLTYTTKRAKLNLIFLLIINLFFTILLIGNIYYFREFSDFLSVDTIFKASANSQGLSGATLNMYRNYDYIYILDTIAFIMYLAFSKFGNNISYKRSFVKQPIGLLLCVFTVFLAEIDRPELLTRSFDNRYLVKYLGLTGYTMKNYHDYNQLKDLRANASENDLSLVQNYIDGRKSNDTDYFGVATDRNVVYIHLESFQQFLIDYKLKDSNGKEHEVTPYLNSIFHSQDTLSFDNSFHQVGQGKTSDAENMLENSLYGLDSGSAMVKFGTDNTFYSAPTILKEYGYTSQVFHGNTDTFWNRNNAYKSYGYDMFYSLNSYESKDILGYGLKDEVFFKESLDKYTKIKGKKYSKFIPVTHHFPYSSDSLNSNFPKALTNDDTVNEYFVTANYMDNQIKIFMEGLKNSGELDNTIFVFYGDHYGISNSRNKTLNEVLNITDDWTGYNNAMLQRTPLMFYIPNSEINKEKEINHNYVGQIDILPTLLNLLGIEDKGYIFMGQNIFGKNYDNIVPFRDGSFVTPKYTYYKEKAYYTETGEQIDLEDESNSIIIKEIKELQNKVNTELTLSDKVLNQNLLQFKYNRQEVTNREKYPY